MTRDTDVEEFAAFTETHPELWALIRRARYDRYRTPFFDGIYTGLRDAVCLVGKFPIDLFEAEAKKAFDL